MKNIKIYLTLFLFSFASIVTAQEKEGLEFTIKKKIPVTSVKNQYRSGTCWSFAGLSYIEAEMLRLGKEAVNLSEMWVVRHSYSDKAVKYVRFHGSLNFGGGGALHDVFNVISQYGMVPEESYQGLGYGTDKHVHGEMDNVLEGYIKKVIENKNRELSEGWHKGFEGILDGYLGTKPEKFNYNGKSYTPGSFAKEYMDINPDHYITISSFTHHPDYSRFILEVPDNWAYGEAYNVKIDEMIEIIDNAIENGYTVAWSADVSEKGFQWSKGVAVVPEVNIEIMSDTEKAKWAELSEKDREKMMYKMDGPVYEKEITPELRQKEFDNYKTTDDHSMHITGIATDQNGKEYYLVKNSWSDEDHIYDGYLYVSKAYVKFKTMSFMVHKDAVPKDIQKKINLL